MERWYLGSMNDGLFIINRPPRPAPNDAGPGEVGDSPTLVVALGDLREDLAQQIIDAHNSALLGRMRE